MFVDPKVVDFFTNEMILAKVNADKDTVIRAQYAVSGFPTLVMLNPKGEEIDRVAGYLPTAEFIQTFRDYGKGIGTLADLLNKAKDSSDRTLYFAIADKYKYRGKPEEAKEWYGKVIAAGQPTDSLSGESRTALADMLSRAKKYDEAQDAYRGIAKEFKGTPFAENADFYVAYIYARRGDTANAIASYEQWLQAYPKSEDTTYVQKAIQKLKNPPADTTKKAGS